jgi:hypothetical protein
VTEQEIVESRMEAFLEEHRIKAVDGPSMYCDYWETRYTVVALNGYVYMKHMRPDPLYVLLPEKDSTNVEALWEAFAAGLSAWLDGRDRVFWRRRVEFIWEADPNTGRERGKISVRLSAYRSV